MPWNIIYFEDVEKFLDKLSKEQLKSIAKEVRLLEFCGNDLKLPHSKSLGGGLFELRERRFGIRLYYGFSNDQIILILHGGAKKTQDKDIKKARVLIKNIEKTNESKKL